MIDTSVLACQVDLVVTWCYFVYRKCCL